MHSEPSVIVSYSDVMTLSWKESGIKELTESRFVKLYGFPDSSVSEEFACNVG